MKLFDSWRDFLTFLAGSVGATLLTLLLAELMEPLWERLPVFAPFALIAFFWVFLLFEVRRGILSGKAQEPPRD